MSQSTSTGAGTRPTTSGGVDNIGAGSRFNPGSDNDSPAPPERMAEKRSDAASIEADDSAPLGHTESAEGARPDTRTPKPA